MAHTALTEEEVQEFHDTPEDLQLKIVRLAELVRAAKHCIVYTGAGLSTSAGIPDFRGPNGVWTRKAMEERGEQVPENAGRPEYAAKREQGVIEPTFSHMVIVGLMNQGLCKFLISSNCDGLHLKSGVPPNMIAEVHGNSNVEACSLCGMCFHRGNQRVRNNRTRARMTGRKCENPDCKGVLRYTTVAFGQSMPDVCLERAEAMATEADLVITLGTSMRVFPSCDLPLAGKAKHGKRHKLVLVNLQKNAS
jgi:NAD-dependent SIR2 family protein deacetylase